jgi:hypothetical protein
MKQAGIFCLLELTTIIGILLGIYLIVGSVTMGYIVLVPDFTNRLDKYGLRSPQLANLVIRGSYLVLATGCLIVAVSLTATIAGLLILILEGSCWLSI